MRKLLILLFLSVCTVSHAAVNLPDFTPLVDEVQPIVASIMTDIKKGRAVHLGPTGSGFIISADGYVLTNHHVVDEAVNIRVRLTDGRVISAKKVGEDEASDIALLKIEASGLKAAKIADLNKLKPGAWVLAFGRPFGFDNTVTAGIVSAKGRSLPWNRYVPFIQSDVAINPGNSGGPLVNINGEVVGINSQILSSSGGSIGLSFSIPIDLAMEVAQQFKAGGQIKRGYLGVVFQAVDEAVIENYGLDRPRGALVSSVEKVGPADKAGFKVGDVITHYDGVLIESSSDLPVLVGRTKPGKIVKIELLRDAKTKVVTLTVGDLKEATGEIASSEQDSGSVSKVTLGISVGDLTPAQLQESGVEHGVLVREVIEGPAADAGIRSGDVIASINRQEINSVSEFRSAVKALKPGRAVPVYVLRKGTGTFLVLRLPE